MATYLNYSTKSLDLSLGLAEALKCSVLKDVVLAYSGGRCLSAHRLILVNFSPFFKQVLSASKETKPTVLLPDISVTVMEILLEFM